MVAGCRQQGGRDRDLPGVNKRIYNKGAIVEFDGAKDDRNRGRHGIGLLAAMDFEWSSAWIAEDLRQDYGERRFRAIGFIDLRLHVLVFTPRDRVIRVISLRRANARETKRYETQAAG